MISRDSVATSYQFIPSDNREVSYAALSIEDSGEGNVREQLISNIMRKLYGDVLADLKEGKIAEVVAVLSELVSESVPVEPVVETPAPVVTPVVEPVVPEPAVVPVVVVEEPIPAPVVVPEPTPVVEPVIEAAVAGEVSDVPSETEAAPAQ